MFFLCKIEAQSNRLNDPNVFEDGKCLETVVPASLPHGLQAFSIFNKFGLEHGESLEDGKSRPNTKHT